MQATGRNSKSSSSDDDLLDETEELGRQRKKHFLDYDYDESTQQPSSFSIDGESHKKINAATHNVKVESNNNCNNNNNNARNIDSNQLDLKKKIIDRPTTSKMASTMDQLNSNPKSAMSNGSGGSSNKNNNVETVYSILSMLGSYNSSDITSKFLEFSKNREMAATLRQSGCISILVQMIHSNPNEENRQKQCLQTLHNIIYCNADDKAGRREARVLKLIEQLFDYCDAIRSILKNELSDNVDRHPIQAIGTLMKISFDEEHRHAMCSLGALQTISTLIQLDHAVHGSISNHNSCITMRRYAGMCLTNLTFGDGNNKALLCSNKNFMKALVDQINSTSDELVQVSASVLRNLSWRADANMKQALNEIETVKILTTVAMKCTQENTLKAILSALWNLSNHCAKNKAEICDIVGAIEFLIDMLSYEAPSKTMAVIENAGGILRNISTHMALYEKYRVILRQKGCFNILLQQLKSPSLTVVSNACGTLGNLSAHSNEDQKFLRDNGAIPMLRSLIYSKHKMISTGSTIALRHLLACKTGVTHNENIDSVAKMMDLKELPTLNVRKQRALEQELNLNSEPYKHDETSPSTKDEKTRDNEVSAKSKANRVNEIKVQDIEDEEDDEDAPTNFCNFDNDEDESEQKCEYQETNLDQITDYSIRYGENQGDDDDGGKRGNILSADDTTKCYNTEGTPHTISKAGSMSDLRKEKLTKEIAKANDDKKVKGKLSGQQTPDKPTNYCVEGTPGNFSRNDSLSDLEEAGLTPPEVKSQKPESSQKPSLVNKNPPPPLQIRKDVNAEKDSVAATPKSVTFVHLADDTPMMFSRTSSMGSLSSAEPAGDDKSSVVSDFSRMASGIMSPSELPDSPTQSIPQSPSRSSVKQNHRNIPVIKAPQGNRDIMERHIVGAEAAEDSVNTFHVENTPAVFSSRTSLSNLSFDDEPKISTDAISKDFHLMKHPSEDEESKAKKLTPEGFTQDVTAEHSDAESSDDNVLLESCINMGINRAVLNKQKESPKNENATRVETCDTSSSSRTNVIPKCNLETMKENPLDMLRSGAPLLPPYLPVVDEINKFIVEDSPCNFSIMSGLSAITIESNINTQQQQQQVKPIAKVEPTVRHEDIATGSSKKSLHPSAADFDDSLSSLSLSDDDTNLLHQAIAAGVNKPMKQEISNPINIPAKPRPSAEAANESISSVDSCDKDDSNSILEQCIRTGINKNVKKNVSKNRDRPLLTSSPKKSMLPTPSSNNSNIRGSPSRKLDKKDASQSAKDDELLKECIATGILKSTKQDLILAENFSHISITDPKNGQTTSVIATDAQCASTITGVGTDTEKNKLITSHNNNNSSSSNNNNNCNEIMQDQNENIDLEREHSLQTWMMQNGSSNNNSNNFDWNGSLCSMDDNVLERSNEYPANKLSTCGDYDEESIMDISNEFIFENEKFTETKIDDKHKNPDLMLKSVDRLTQELVQTAEYLRNNALILDDNSGDKMSSSLSNNNTWNDENSFPSISMTAPMIGSTNDEMTFATDQIQPIPLERPQPDEQNQFNDKTPTNENFVFNIKNDEDDCPSLRIDFKLGGEIGSQSLSKGNIFNCMKSGPASIDTCSTMSNSTIVQMEAKRITNKLLTSKMMDSTTSLDLENIRPPSSMDSIMSSYQDLSIQQSPFKTQPKKNFITGLVAKRALGHQVFCGSIDSVNSINNIDSIRPPSIMDELLDSMISVDSIVSEIVDPTLGISNYETALSDMEDSLTLRSCQDLSKDETLTPISSDFSSVESTPKKKQRNVRAGTPKQKRQTEKERYKTYTIAIDMLLKEQQNEMQNSLTESSRKNARQRRQEDRQRFETQVINHSPEPTSPNSSVLKRKEEPERYRTYNIESEMDDDFSIRAMTAKFDFIRTEKITTPTNSGGNIFDPSGLRNKLNRIKSGSNMQNVAKQNDDSLEYEHQTSETESQRDLKASPISVENKIPNVDSPKSPDTKQDDQQSKIKSVKTSYISPYRMTTKITPTKSKSVRVTKTPIIAKIVTKNSLKSSAAKANATNEKPNGMKSRFGVIPKSTPINSPNVAKANTNVQQAKEKPAAPIRQGTFVKDEPTNENVPVVDAVENVEPPIKTPPTSQLSKLKPPTRIALATKTPSVESKNSSPKRTSNLPTSITQMKYRSNSNASMKIKEISNPPVRSNTGITLNNPKRNVTSKIAGIWKNNDKKDVSLKKPTASFSSPLLNLSNGNGSKAFTPTGNVNRKIVGSPIKERIKRSSTCDEIV